jgi:hypothetical protein
MEGTGPNSDLQIKVERGFAWSRLENQVMASAYECVCPILRRVPSYASRVFRSAELLKTVGLERRCATGA